MVRAAKTEGAHHAAKVLCAELTNAHIRPIPSGTEPQSKQEGRRE